MAQATYIEKLQEFDRIDDRTHAANEHAEFVKRHPEYAVVRDSRAVADMAVAEYVSRCVWACRAVDPAESERIYQQALAREQGAVYFLGV